VNYLDHLVVKISADATIYTRVMDGVQQKALQTARNVENGLNRMLHRMSSGLATLGRRISYAVTAPLVGLAGASLKVFSDFDDAINRTVAIAGDVSSDLRKKMEENAKAISRGGRTAPTDLAKGYYHLVAAGLTAEESLKGLAIAEQFAVSGAIDMEKATTLLVDSQTVLGMRLKDSTANAKAMGDVADILTRAGIETQASPEQFARALVTKSGAQARLLGKDIKEVVGVLMAMASQGTRAELAGEQLYIMMRDVQGAAVKNKEAWDMIVGPGAVYDVGTGKMRHLADIIETLEGKLLGLSDEQRKMTLGELGFTDRSVAATTMLIGMSKDIRKYEASLGGAGGDNARIAAEQTKSFAGQVTNLSNQFLVLAIDIGQLLVPHLMQAMEYVRMAVDWWFTLSASAKKAILVIGAIAAAVGPLLLIVGSLGLSISLAVTGFGLVTGFLSSLWAMGPAILAIGAAVASVVALMVKDSGFVWSWTAAKEAMTNFADKAIGFLENFQANMRILWDWWAVNWKKIMVEDPFRLLITMFTNTVLNARVMAMGVMRVFVAFQGFMGKLWKHVFEGEFIHYSAKGLVTVMSRFSAFATWAAKVMMNIWKKRPPPDAKEFMATLGEDLMRGFEAPGLAAFGSQIMDIINETIGDLKSPFFGFESSVVHGPKFIFDHPNQVADDGLGGIKTVADEAERIVDAFAEPVRIRFDMSGIEALRVGSLADKIAMATYMEKRAMAGPAAVAKGPMPAAAAAALERGGGPGIGSKTIVDPFTAAVDRLVETIEVFGRTWEERNHDRPVIELAPLSLVEGAA
jgi:TP901 family phage tail tape measure protein